jgi:hypothetical protein
VLFRSLSEGNRTELNHTSLKPSQICFKNSIDFFHAECTIVCVFESKPIPLFYFHFALLWVQDMPHPHRPQLGWTAIRLLTHPFMVLNHLEGFI